MIRELGRNDRRGRAAWTPLRAATGSAPVGGWNDASRGVVRDNLVALGSLVVGAVVHAIERRKGPSS
jgi:hypothetical protein